jgi:hypothetical protein
MGSSSEGLDPTLDEGSDKLEAQKLLLWGGSKLLDFLHQRLRDLHLLVRKIMFPGYTGPKVDNGLEFLKPKVSPLEDLSLA